MTDEWEPAAPSRQGQPAQRSQKRFDLIPFSKIVLGTAPAYLVKGLLPRLGLAVVWGPPKCGKSFFIFDLMMHVALGWPYRERRVKQGAVVYCALEGCEGFRSRIEAFRVAKLGDWGGDVPFYLSPTPLNLFADHTALATSIRKQITGRTPAAIVIDTVNRSLNGSESDDKDMGNYIKAADWLRDAFQCLVLVIHHSGVDASRPRGHTSLAGAVDAQIAVKKDGAGNVVGAVEFMKDGPEGERVTSRLVSTEVGTDDDGEAITSCVVEPVDDDLRPTAGTTDKPKKVLPDRQRLGLDVLIDCSLSYGKPLPASHGIPGNPRAVEASKWRDALFSRGVLDRDAKNPREDFARVKRSLLAKRLAGERDGLVWAVS